MCAGACKTSPALDEMTLLSVRENSALSTTTSRDDSPWSRDDSPFASSHDSIQRLAEAIDTERMLTTRPATVSDVISFGQLNFRLRRRPEVE